MPNADTLIKIANTFNTSIDYLLLDSTEPMLAEIQDSKLLKYFDELSKMSDKDKEVIESLIEAYVKKKKVEAIMTS